MGEFIVEVILGGIIDGFFWLIGKTYLLLRYGKRQKEVLDKEYDGSYSGTGRLLTTQFWGILWVLLLGIIWVSMILGFLYYGLKYLYNIIW